jgi:uncharacterized protein DUF3237
MAKASNVSPIDPQRNDPQTPQPSWQPARYRFNLDIQLNPLVGVASGTVKRRVAGGTRLYLDYSGGEVKTTADRISDLEQAIRRAATPGKYRLLLEEFNYERIARNDPDAAANPERTALAAMYERLTTGLDANGSTPKDAERFIRDLAAFAQAIADYDIRRNGNGYYRSPRRDEASFDKDLGGRGFWTGLTGEIITSGDWALLREDGIFTLDARFTIQAKDGALIAALLTGAGDLSRVYDGATGEEAYRKWTSGEAPDQKVLPMSTNLRFYAPGPPGSESVLIAKRYRTATRHYWKYVSLGQGVFVGLGSLSLMSGSSATPAPELGFATGLSLEVHELVAAPSRGNG